MKKKKITQEKVIRKFVNALRKKHRRKLRITEWPDKTNRKTSDIDSIIVGHGSKKALEHTTVDSFPKQRERSAIFMKAVGDIQKELKGRIKSRIRIGAREGAIRKGQDWASIKKLIKKWILKNDGRQFEREIKIEGVPFSLIVSFEKSARPGVFPRRYISSRLLSKLPRVLKTMLSKKAAQLAPYKLKGHRTILLLESSDIALMSPQKMATEFQKVFSTKFKSKIDEVWLADTTIPQELQFWDLLSNPLWYIS